MATIEATRSDRPVGLGASTLCEAFQLTAAEHPERVALRTKGGEFELTWGDYAQKVKRLAAGFAALGLERGQTLGVMLTNRPEFHFADTAAMHLGATPFSVYNTYSAEQIEYLVGDAASPILVTEQAFLDRVLEVQKACTSLKHVVVVDGDVPVPRIREKLKAAMESGIEAEQDPERKKATQWALGVGLKKVQLEQAGEEVPEELAAEHANADEQVLSTIRSMLGLDELESLNVGAAPTPREVIEFFHALGLPLAELWGMSETTGAGACNPPDKVKIGTVGPAAPGIEIKLADDGEVLIRGPVVMPGYRNSPEQTSEAIDSDGWLHTGDIGELDEDGYLKIVDRKKELIINAGGKNMSPANIEAKVKAAHPLIGQAIAIGDGRPYNVALITLDPDVAPAVAQQHGIEDTSFENLAAQQAILDEVQKGVDAANESLARVEQIKKFKLLPTDWEPGGDELTPTMKLKRKPIAEKYSAEIDELYSS